MSNSRKRDYHCGVEWGPASLYQHCGTYEKKSVQDYFFSPAGKTHEVRRGLQAQSTFSEAARINPAGLQFLWDTLVFSQWASLQFRYTFVVTDNFRKYPGTSCIISRLSAITPALL